VPFCRLCPTDRCRSLGLALPHPQPCRTRLRHVRHGHRPHRRGGM